MTTCTVLVPRPEEEEEEEEKGPGFSCLCMCLIAMEFHGLHILLASFCNVILNLTLTVCRFIMAAYCVQMIHLIMRI